MVWLRRAIAPVVLAMVALPGPLPAAGWCWPWDTCTKAPTPAPTPAPRKHGAEKEAPSPAPSPKPAESHPDEHADEAGKNRTEREKHTVAEGHEGRPAERRKERPAEKRGEKPAQERPAEKRGEKPAEERPAEKHGEKPAERPAEKHGEKPAEKRAEKPAEKQEPDRKPAETRSERSAGGHGEKPTEKGVERPAEKHKAAGRHEERPAERHKEKRAEKDAERPAESREEKPAEKRAERPEEKHGEKSAERHQEHSDRSAESSASPQHAEGPAEKHETPAQEQAERVAVAKENAYNALKQLAARVHSFAENAEDKDGVAGAVDEAQRRVHQQYADLWTDQASRLESDMKALAKFKAAQEKRTDAVTLVEAKRVAHEARELEAAVESSRQKLREVGGKIPRAMDGACRELQKEEEGALDALEARADKEARQWKTAASNLREAQKKAGKAVDEEGLRRAERQSEEVEAKAAEVRKSVAHLVTKFYQAVRIGAKKKTAQLTEAIEGEYKVRESSINMISKELKSIQARQATEAVETSKKEEGSREQESQQSLDNLEAMVARLRHVLSDSSHAERTARRIEADVANGRSKSSAGRGKELEARLEAEERQTKEHVHELQEDAQRSAHEWLRAGKTVAEARRRAKVGEGKYEREEDELEGKAQRRGAHAEAVAERFEGQVERYFDRVRGALDGEEQRRARLRLSSRRTLDDIQAKLPAAFSAGMVAIMSVVALASAGRRTLGPLNAARAPLLLSD